MKATTLAIVLGFFTAGLLFGRAAEAVRHATAIQSSQCSKADKAPRS